MNEEAKQEELVDEGEVVEVDLPEEKASGKIADLATPEETDQEAAKAIDDVSEEPQQKSEDELEDYSEKVKKSAKRKSNGTAEVLYVLLKLLTALRFYIVFRFWTKIALGQLMSRFMFI